MAGNSLLVSNESGTYIIAVVSIPCEEKVKVSTLISSGGGVVGLDGVAVSESPEQETMMDGRINTQTRNFIPCFIIA